MKRCARYLAKFVTDKKGGLMGLQTYFSNVVLYYVIRSSNALIILFLVPYTARRLDHDNFSSLMLTITLSIFVCMLVSYGDYLSGIRNAAREKYNLQNMSQIISETLTAKRFLALFALLITSLLVSLQYNHSNITIYYCALMYGICLGFSPLWIYQSINQLKILATMECVFSLGAGLLFFLLLPRYPYYTTALCILIIGRLILNFAASNQLKRYGMKLYHAPWHRAWYRIKDGFNLFALTACISLYGTLSTVLLSYFSGLAAIGAFAGIERLTRSMTSCILPLSHALIPQLYFLHDEHQKKRALNNTVLIGTGCISLIVAGTLFIFSELWVQLLLGSNYPDAVHLLKILAWLIPCFILSTILSSQYLIPIHQDKLCNIVYVTGGIISVVLAIIIVPRYGAIGMASVVLLAELSVLFFMAIAVIHHYWLGNHAFQRELKTL